MAKVLYITGMDKVLRNMKKASKGYEAKFERGLKKAGLFVQRESMRIVPVDTANLKGGAFTRNVGGKGAKTDVVVGYVADYAVHVHENLDAKHKPGKQAKYLESVMRKERNKIFKIVAKG